MIDIKRKVPRFRVQFKILSNHLEGQGINISQKGIGFLTEEEIVPADKIPFETEIKGYIFSNKTYTIRGWGKLLFSKQTTEYGDLFYNGFQFNELDQSSHDSLIELLSDIRHFQKEPENELENKTLADFNYYPSEDIFSKASLFYHSINKQITHIFEMFSYNLDSPNTSTANFIQRKTKNAKRMIMLGSNNYLGLTTHPAVIKAGIDALKRYGSGNGCGAMVGGTLSIHKELEEALAAFTGKEAVMLFNSGYSTNVGVISGLLRPQDAIINDQLNHASIIDGSLFSGAKTLLFSHNNTQSLEKIIKRAKLHFNGLMVVVDGVYSTSGGLAPLNEIVALAQKYKNIRIMVDEAHGLGILGEKGIGASEHFNLVDKIDIIMGTMSKSLAGVGGFIASNKEVIEYLRYYSRPYLFSTGITPSAAGSILKALEILQHDKSIREKLNANIKLFKSRLLALGLDIGMTQSAIVPIFIANKNLLLKISSRLFQEGVFHNVLVYPAVPMGGSLIRFGLTASHNEKELNIALDKIEKIVTTEGLLEYYKQQKEELLKYQDDETKINPR
jgi:glycine C-acetyltransferase